MGREWPFPFVLALSLWPHLAFLFCFSSHHILRHSKYVLGQGDVSLMCYFGLWRLQLGEHSGKERIGTFFYGDCWTDYGFSLRITWNLGPVWATIIVTDAVMVMFHWFKKRLSVVIMQLQSAKYIYWLWIRLWIVTLSFSHRYRCHKFECTLHRQVLSCAHRYRPTSLA